MLTKLVSSPEIFSGILENLHLSEIIRFYQFKKIHLFKDFLESPKSYELGKRLFSYLFFNPLSDWQSEDKLEECKSAIG